MVRLMREGEWYDPIAVGAQYESDYEQLLLSKSGELFPGYVAVPFKCAVESETDRRIPDLALIDPTYRDWWVVEVEMSNHSLAGHVLPQIEVFVTGRYSINHVRYLQSKSEGFDGRALHDMMKGAQPKVLVVVNQPRPTWEAPIHNAGARLAVVQVFRSEKNEHMFSLNGDQPVPDTRTALTTCRLDTSLHTLLTIDSPAGLPVRTGERVTIYFGGGSTTWHRLDTEDTVWLVPHDRVPLDLNTEYAIYSDNRNRLTIEKSI